MNLPYISFIIIPKLMEICMTHFRITSTYNSIYFKAFQQASSINYNQAELTATAGEEKENNTFYDRRLVLADKQLDKELKSNRFTSL